METSIVFKVFIKLTQWRAVLRSRHLSTVCEPMSIKSILANQNQTHAVWQSFEKHQNKRQMYGSYLRLGWTCCHTFKISLICMAVRLGWTDCHTCLLFVWQ